MSKHPMKQSQLVDYEYDGVTCPECGGQYSNRAGLSKHFNSQHGEKFKPLAACDFCEKLYTETPANLHASEKTYCSKGCRKASFSKNRSGEKNPNHKEKQRKKCDQCGGFFEKVPSKSNQRFCSENCYHTYVRETGILKGENNPCYKERLVLECEWCHSEYKVPPVHKNSRFCSADCRHEWLSSRTGKEHPLWEGGTDWYTTIRQELGPTGWHTLRKKNLKNKCELCGVDESPNGRDLSLHHIVPVLSGGTNSEYNFMTLCEPCHSNVESYCSDLPGFEKVLLE